MTEQEETDTNQPVLKMSIQNSLSEDSRLFIMLAALLLEPTTIDKEVGLPQNHRSHRPGYMANLLDWHCGLTVLAIFTKVWRSKRSDAPDTGRNYEINTVKSNPTPNWLHRPPARSLNYQKFIEKFIKIDDKHGRCKLIEHL